MIFGSARLDVNAGEGNYLRKNLKIVKCIQKETPTRQVLLFRIRKSVSGVCCNEFRYVNFLD